MVGLGIALATVFSALGSTTHSPAAIAATPDYLIEPGFAKPVAPVEGVTEYAQRLLDLTNVERGKAGLEPLTLNPMLTDAAQWMAKDMASNDYFDHLDRQGRRVGARVYDFGYRAWKAVGENIAAGHKSPVEVVAQWMASPCHRRNILRPDFTEMGIGFASSQSGQYDRYWVQAFGTRPSYVANRTQ